MAVTYPTTPTTLTLTSAFAGAILDDYRESGFVQGTAVVRDANLSKRSADVYRLVRKIDFKTVKTLSVAGVQTALATTDILQVLPLSAGDTIVGGSLRVITASGSSVENIIVQVGSTALTTSVDTLTLHTQTFSSNVPLAITSKDTLDFLMTATSASFSGKVEVVALIAPARG